MTSSKALCEVSFCVRCGGCCDDRYAVRFHGKRASYVQTQQDYATRFNNAWQLVEERYWDPTFEGVDWDAVRLEYEPQALAAKNDRAFYGVLESMYGELGDNHSVFVPPDRVEEIRLEYGDLPCLGVFGSVQGSQGNRGKVSFELLDAGVGYLRVPDLATPGTSQNLRRAVQDLNRKGAQSFVLDLRGNPGGRLVEMMQTAGIFTSGFLWRTLTRWTLPLPYPALGAVETELPLAVLIDGDVNSAAEGLAGALQANGRATVVGETKRGQRRGGAALLPPRRLASLDCYGCSCPFARRDLGGPRRGARH